MHENDDDDLRTEARAEERARRRAWGPCQCFGPGEAGGTCPGPANCPMAGGDEPPEESAADE